MPFETGYIKEHTLKKKKKKKIKKKLKKKKKKKKKKRGKILVLKMLGSSNWTKEK